MAGETHGQDPGQGNSPEQGDAGGDNVSGGKTDRLADMEARFELLNDSLVELRTAILSTRASGSGAAAAQAEIDDDDEPLTASKVKKIVQSSVAGANAQNQNLNQRQQWDDKAKSEFPLADPKFLREFKREWREQVDAGLDPNHPKAVYNVAKLTARATGVKKPAARDAETTQTSEAPTSSQTPRPTRSGSARAVGDDDSRVRFYAMKGDKTKDQIAAFKQKLGEKDAQRRSNK